MICGTNIYIPGACIFPAQDGDPLCRLHAQWARASAVLMVQSKNKEALATRRKAADELTAAGCFVPARN